MRRSDTHQIRSGSQREVRKKSDAHQIRSRYSDTNGTRLAAMPLHTSACAHGGAKTVHIRQRLVLERGGQEGCYRSGPTCGFGGAVRGLFLDNRGGHQGHRVHADHRWRQDFIRVEEFGHPSNHWSKQFARTSAFEAALRSGTELIGTIVACA
jgi:hypothetical protein